MKDFASEVHAGDKPSEGTLAQWPLYLLSGWFAQALPLLERFSGVIGMRKTGHHRRNAFRSRRPKVLSNAIHSDIQLPCIKYKVITSAQKSYDLHKQTTAATFYIKGCQLLANKTE